MDGDMMESRPKSITNYYWTQITLVRALIMHKFMQIFSSGCYVFFCLIPATIKGRV